MQRARARARVYMRVRVRSCETRWRARRRRENQLQRGKREGDRRARRIMKGEGRAGSKSRNIWREDIFYNVKYIIRRGRGRARAYTHAGP